MVNIIKKLREARKCEKGSFLVEFVMLMPVVILIIGFVMTVGQGMIAKNIVQNAAFQAARMAVVEQRYQDGHDKAVTTATDITNSIIGQNKQDLDVKLTTNAGGWKKGETATCTVSTTFKPLFPFLGQTSMPITGQMTVMIENDINSWV